MIKTYLVAKYKNDCLPALRGRYVAIDKLSHYPYATENVNKIKLWEDSDAGATDRAEFLKFCPALEPTKIQIIIKELT